MTTRSGLLSKKELRQFVKEHTFQSAEVFITILQLLYNLI